ncbi:MAG: hypothetical protein CL724_00960 [Chloroflexi bacterium]|jgi:hypothetical protein|nr:hypothetical protein [Chloroflexota bacterium]
MRSKPEIAVVGTWLLMANARANAIIFVVVSVKLSATMDLTASENDLLVGLSIISTSILAVWVGRRSVRGGCSRAIRPGVTNVLFAFPNKPVVTG